jgi:glutamate 5-kinase
VGTVFLPRRRKMGARQRWIGLTRRPAGGVSIDAGALTALVRQNRSLLAIGITDVQGRFERGQVIAVLGPDRVEAARGLSNYSSEEIRLIMGRRSSQFEKILGRAGYGEVIHRDNLVVIGRDDADAPAPADA